MLFLLLYVIEKFSIKMPLEVGLIFLMFVAFVGFALGHRDKVDRMESILIWFAVHDRNLAFLSKRSCNLLYNTKLRCHPGVGPLSDI